MQDEIPVKEIDDSVPHEIGEIDLYQKREKIYTRDIQGKFQKIRTYTGWPLLLGYFLMPWINWDGRQSILFDLPERKFHILGATFWPQDFMILAFVLIIAAFALFLFTTLFGRVWCGYSCPQTVWTSIFMWVEQKTEGSRNQRIKLDEQPWSFNKFRRKFLKHGMWFTFSFITAFTFVGYFTPIKQLVPELLVFDAHPWAMFWTAFFAFATYMNAGWLREQVCMYMCPYARFQGAMFDANTLIVSYDPGRGESRGSRKKGADYQSQGLGDCIDCELCVQVCPTGIDIRNGLQAECIGCALCIDACDSIMEKMAYPKGLISYTTENHLKGQKERFWRPKSIGYMVAFIAMIGLLVSHIVDRTPLELEVIRDRSSLFQETTQGNIENIYTVKILNMDKTNQHFQVSLEGLENAVLQGTTRVLVESGEVFELPLRVSINKNQLNKNNYTIVFKTQSEERPELTASQESRFLAPFSKSPTR
jgi:cytochrome c oxidase accessory protein FixG